MNSEPQQATFIVVVNDEGQYSIWPKAKEIPLGWKPDGMQGSKDECLALIATVWTDMRPRSLKEAMNQQYTSRAAANPAQLPD
ncbi:MbtH family protein [Photorhabdus sp. RM96S]|uniref:MbtH family protein n=1 Tax=Photorhabdus sp. RM96S TaxID=3342822 RepID=UPI0036DF8885